MTPEESRQLNKDVYATFHDFEPGRKVYQWLEKLCFKYKVGMVIGKPDESAYNEGHRDVIIEIDGRMQRATEPPQKPMDTINRKD